VSGHRGGIRGHPAGDMTLLRSFHRKPAPRYPIPTIPSRWPYGRL
jgi:hypothetical protein